MRAVDTNVLVRILTRDDPHQTARADQFVHGGVWVSLVVLAETLWVLASAYQRTSQEVASALDYLLNHEHLVFQDGDAVTDAAKLFRERPGLGFADCLVLALARKFGHLPLGTFDRKLGNLAGTVIV